MKSLNHFFKKVWFGYKRISKKIHTTSLVVLSGTVVMAIVTLGVNGFATEQQVVYGINQEKEKELEELEVVQEDTSTSIEAEVEAEIQLKKTLEDQDKMEQVNQIKKEIVEEKSLRASNKNVENHLVESLSIRDYTAMVRIVEAEATDEDIKGKILVANVVMNRVASKGFPNSIYEVVHQKINGRAQFSPIDDGRYYTLEISATTVEAVEKALSGTDDAEGALFFVAKSLTSEKAGSWFDQHLKFVKKYGVHSFYKY